MLVIRSIFFYIGYVLAAIFFGTLALPLMLLPYRYRRIITAWNRFSIFWLSFCCGIKVEIRGYTDSLDKPVVVIANHQSSWETLFLQYHFHPIATILKKELLYIPFMGWGLQALRSIAIDRSNPRKAIKQVREKGQARIDEGISVLVFPQGTRQEYGSDGGNYARSGADIAIAAGVAIVPVSHNAGQLWPPHKLIKKPGTLVVNIGAPISTEDRNSKELTAEVRNWIETNIV